MIKDFSYGVVPVYQTETGFEFLLIQHHAGHWGFPKGHAKGDESPLATAQREFEEETGIVNFQLIKEVTFTEEYYPPADNEIVHKKVTYFLGLIKDQSVQPQAEEVQAYKWLEYRPALKQITFSGSKKILRRVKVELEKRLSV